MRASPPRRPWAGWRWKLAAAGVVVLGIGSGVWYLQNLQHQRQVQACRDLRQQIGTFKSQVFDARMKRMRSVRLNDAQATTLRTVDPNAYARYATAYGETVDQVAQAADQLAELVERYRSATCLAID